ncbi:LOW QUALITY PROTEIN: hypothetical protein CFOL_v3_02947, partial [Cephalotus follicularis]
FHESWERLKDLIRKCPHHAIPTWQLVQCFYYGLTAQNRQMVDPSCGGTFMHKSEDEAWQLFESLSENSLHHLSSRVESSTMGTQKKGGIYEVSQFETIKAKVDILSQYQVVGNPRNQSGQCSHLEQAQAITTLRSGRVIGEPHVNFPNPNMMHDKSPEEKVSSESSEKETLNKGKEKDIILVSPKAPFRGCLRSLIPPFGKKVGRMDKMMEMFKQVQINLPLLDAIQQVPAYAKFLKDLCTTKRKLKTHIPKMVHLTEQVSTVLSNKLPPKLKDPVAPLISCKIGNLQIERALLDLEASVNILPSSVYDHFGLGELRPTTMTLQLADRSVKVPRGEIEDALIKVEFFFPVDFVVLDTQPVANLNDQIPVILGRPFLATSNALINCQNGLMKLSFRNTSVDFNIFRLGKHSADFD